MTDVRGSRVVELIEDPAVTGELLLVALGLAATFDFGLEYGRKLSGLSALLWGERPSRWRIRMALESDMRTYRPPAPDARHCTAPMIRRSSQCGRNPSASGYLTDWSTGEKSYFGGCSRHRDWFYATQHANRKAKPETPPLPCANHGGVLIPHFPRIDWRSFWRRLDPSWVEHPEVKPWPKPDLSLVLGDDEGGSGSPALSVINGGAA